MDERCLQEALDADPQKRKLRVELAKLLSTTLDPRAPGYFALGSLALNPAVRDGRYLWGRVSNPSLSVFALYPDCFLPDDWFAMVRLEAKRQSDLWCEFFTRREADDAAALAFRRLKHRRWRELLERR